MSSFIAMNSNIPPFFIKRKQKLTEQFLKAYEVFFVPKS